MSTTPARSDFLMWFDRFARGYRRLAALHVACATLAVVLLALAAFAACDYLFELDRRVRVGVTFALVAAVVAASVAAMRIWRRASDPAVAAEMERRFPELGQAVRTSVQFGRDAPAGVSPALLAAMRVELEEKAAALPLHEALPKRGARKAAWRSLSSRPR